MADRIVIYRPSRFIGLGHALVSMAGYAAMAARLGARFVTTFDRCLGDLYGDEAQFIDRFIAPVQRPDLPVQVGLGVLRKSVRRQRRAGGRAVVLGRQSFPRRAQREFPYLKTGDFLDITLDQDRITPETLAAYDLIYADSIWPPHTVIRRFGPSLSPLRLNPAYLDQVYRRIGSRNYIGLHARHGNGEHLHGRIEGDMAPFTAFLGTLAHEARQHQDQAGAETILCLSDNSDTAQQLISLSQGQGAGVDFLPDQQHRAFLSADPDTAAAKVEKVMFDFAVLAGARHIVAGPSLFPRAAGLLGEGTGLTILKPDQPTVAEGAGL